MFKNSKTQLFELLVNSCLSEGGDGDSVLICDEYKRAANDFDQWLKDNNDFYWTRDGECFYNNQECIHFKEKPTNVAPTEIKVWYGLFD